MTKTKKPADRPPERIGPFELSVQGSVRHESIPRRTLAIDRYTHVEVSISREGKPVSPDEIGLPHFSPYFSPDGRARCMSTVILRMLRDDLQKAAA